ncbi:MAG: marine proteobacterial sortase target protein [Gammaproteobacteria bacterium]|jgi:Ca-activated chloride channel homolog|nr:marine proteobacterial sortase target protein [Gammaproteobacteria bacterium]
MQARPSFIKTVNQCVKESIRIGLLFNLLLAFLVLALTSFAQANVTEEVTDTSYVRHPSEMKQGSLLFKDDNKYQNAPVLYTDVQISVTGMIARTKVKQAFRNASADWKEAVYVFPLPETAAVDHMRMHIGERIIEGQIKEKNIAKKQYKAARKAGKKASLIEQERPNIFTTSLANIGPNETIVVEIEYQQIIKYDLGEFSLRFPSVVAPRYIPGNKNVKGFAGTGWATNTNEVADASRITPPVLNPELGKINPLSIHIDLDAGIELIDINSPYHPIEVVQQSRKTDYTIRLKESTIPADRDFVLNWKASEKNTPQAAFFKESKNGSDYGLLMIVPPKNERGAILNRELIFVIDTSGSMAGTSIAQAKSALQLALSRLQSGDRFNIIQFNSYTSQLFPQPVAVSGRAMQQARNYVNSLSADGGTEMASAIRAALINQSNDLDIRQVVFLTDGSVGNEDALFSQVEQFLGSSRLFTIGIGSAPNSHFMNRAAKFGRGTHTYIGNIAEVQKKMGKLFSKLESPVLSDISLKLPANRATEIWPQKIPDLYLGEPLLISIKSTSLPDKIEVNGNIADAAWRTTLSLRGGQERVGISTLWARRKISALMDQRLHGSEQKLVEQAIVSTALEHHLVSKFTSLLAVDVTPSRKREELLKKHALPVNLPAGWKHKKVFAAMPKTATPATLYFIIGLIFLLLSFFSRSPGSLTSNV